MKASKGSRRRTRSKLSKRKRDKGLSPITRLLQKFEAGEKACIVIDPSVHRGQPHSRFQGSTGVILGERGRAYLLEIRIGGKQKRIISSPAHLRKMTGGSR